MAFFRRVLFIVCLVSGCLTGAENKIPEHNNFWQAAADAEEIGIVNSRKRGNDLKLTGLLSGKKTDAKLTFPLWTIWQFRTPGDYLVPLKKKDTVYEISGRNYSIPAMEPGNTGKYKELIEQYKKLKPEEETAFLKKTLCEESCASLAFPCLARLVLIGEFSRSMSKKECNFWAAVYAQKNMTVSFRRLLLYQLARSNFYNSIAVFEAALKDSRLSTMAGEIFFKKDREKFEKLMVLWLADEKLRSFALMNSRRMVKNPAYTAQAMKYFKPADRQELIYFIPVLCSSANKKGRMFIKNFLTAEKDKRHFLLYSVLMDTISTSRSTEYTEELKVFLKNHRDDRFVTGGVVYPKILVCLCLANDPEGYKRTLEYISGQLNLGSEKRSDKVKISNFMRVFHLYNTGISKLEDLQKDIQGKLAKAEAAKSKAGK
ncbi:MAG: hypothetical protein PHV82_05765 [Victivallaceae bacterium]|nr:hypothetical protein [Victivallaceae bacterium]